MTHRLGAAAGGMMAKNRADKTLGQLRASKGRDSLAAELNAPAKNPDCEFCDHLKSKVDEDKKKFFLETEHLRGAIQKCLERLAGYLRGAAYDDFKESLQLNVRYISESKDVDGGDELRRGGDENMSGGDDQSAEIAKLRKRIERCEDEIERLEQENMKLQKELDGRSRSVGSMMASRKRGMTAEKEVQTDMPIPSSVVSAGGRKFGGQPSQGTFDDGKSKMSELVLGRTGEFDIGSPRGSPRGSPSNRVRLDRQTSHEGQTAALMANKAKSVGLGMSPPPGKSSLWGSALAGIKDKKKAEEKARLERLQKELADALERMKQLEQDNKELRDKLKKTEEALAEKTKALEKLERKQKLEELKAKRAGNMKQSGPTPPASRGGPKGEQNNAFPDASTDQGLGGSDDDMQTSVDWGSSIAHDRQLMPVRDGTGCKKKGREGSPAKEESLNTTGKVYKKHVTSAPQLASLGKAAPKTIIPLNEPITWIEVEPYLQNMWHNPRTGGAFVHTPKMPLAKAGDADRPGTDPGIRQRPGSGIGPWPAQSERPGTVPNMIISNDRPGTDHGFRPRPGSGIGPLPAHSESHPAQDSAQSESHNVRERPGSVPKLVLTPINRKQAFN